MRNGKKVRGFTLIELVAVLVIMAIIALIVTPLVMNIIRKARISADKRSVDAYGKAVELGVATHLLDTGDYPTNLDNLTVEYSGNDNKKDRSFLMEWPVFFYLPSCQNATALAAATLSESTSWDMGIFTV